MLLVPASGTAGARGACRTLRRGKHVSTSDRPRSHHDASARCSSSSRSSRRSGPRRPWPPPPRAPPPRPTTSSSRASGPRTRRQVVRPSRRRSERHRHRLAGNVYVTLPAGFAKFNSAGTHVCTYTGDNGYTAGSATASTSTARGNVFLADRTNHRIAKLHPPTNGVNGTNYTWMSLPARMPASETPTSAPATASSTSPPTSPSTATTSTSPTCSTTASRSSTIDSGRQPRCTSTATWGKNGGDGSLRQRRRRVLQAAGHRRPSRRRGHVFVAEEFGRRVQEFTTAGVFVGKFGRDAPSADPLVPAQPDRPRRGRAG